MATTYYNNIQQLYVAYFNRPADTAGLAYWETVVEGAKGSTAAVSAAFAASAEYQSTYSGMTNAQIVNAVYMNLFGRPAETAGQTYWANLLTNGQITIDQVVTQIAAGAQGTDATAYADKVAAATAFTSALGTTNAYSGTAANTAAKAFLSGIVDNASLAAATDPYVLATTVASVNAAGTPFSLQSGLAALDAANTAHANFLASVNGGTASAPTTDPAITAALGTKTAAVAAIIGPVDLDVPGAAGIYTNTSTSAAVKAALVTEAQSNLAATLAADQAKVTADNAAIAKVSGLNAIITAYNSAASSTKAAVSADLAAQADLAAKIASYNVLNSTAAITAPGAGSYTISGLITTDSSGNLKLATGVTETTNPGVTALLNSLTAEKTADMSLAAAQSAQANAQINLDVADLSTAGKTYLTGTLALHLGDSGYTTGTPTAAQILTEQSYLLATKTTADAAAVGAAPGSAAATNAANADAAYTNFNGYIAAFHAANVNVPTATLSGALAADTAAVTTDQGNIASLTKALAALATATTTATELAAITAQGVAATNAFAANGYLTPVTLDSTHNAVVATAGSDIYIAGTNNASIAGFGLVGNDALYIGTKYTLGTDIAHGNDSVLEAFIANDGNGNTTVTLEQKAFASNESTTADLVTITLTGVNAANVHLANGIITVSH